MVGARAAAAMSGALKTPFSEASPPAPSGR